VDIKKGCVVAIPVCGIHRDPEIYPEPEKFDPERFNAENKAARSPYAFLPFGQGPRNCIGEFILLHYSFKLYFFFKSFEIFGIGMRFALIEVKTALCQIVKNFSLEPCAKTPIPMEFDNSSSLAPVGGMWLTMKTRNH